MSQGEESVLTDNVRDAARLLLQLLDDPHPGQATWLAARESAARKLLRLLQKAVTTLRFEPADHGEWTHIHTAPNGTETWERTP